MQTTPRDGYEQLPFVWRRASLLVALLISLVAVVDPAPAAEQREVVLQRVKPMGCFVRVAYNNEGWVTLGYRTANESIGEDWMLLEVGVTVMKGVRDYRLKYADIYLVTPGLTVVHPATRREFNEADRLWALNERARIASDSIDYAPIGASRECTLGLIGSRSALRRFWWIERNPPDDVTFYPPRPPADMGSREEVELSPVRYCSGSLYFHLPTPIRFGMYYLYVRFANSTVGVPFKIMTEAESREAEKAWTEARR